MTKELQEIREYSAIPGFKYNQDRIKFELLDGSTKLIFEYVIPLNKGSLFVLLGKGAGVRVCEGVEKEVLEKLEQAYKQYAKNLGVRI